VGLALLSFIERQYRACVERREPCQYHEEVVLDGEPTHWETRIAPVVINDEVAFIAGSTRNVTEQREQKRELEAEQRFITQALDALDDLFYVVDEDGSLQRWNERATAVTGYTETALDGLTVTGLFAEGQREAVEAALEAALDSEQLTAEADLVTADGRQLPYEFTVAPLTDVDGETTGLVGIGRDLTERRQRERRFQALVEQSNDIVSIIDTNGRYIYQSPSLERLLGYDPEETLGERAWGYIHPDDRERVEATFERGLANPEEVVTVEYRARHADGSWRWMAANGSNQLDDPIVNGYVVNSRDITEQVQHRERLEEFASVVSHDLRNPLQVVRGRLALASDECDSPHLDSAFDALERSETLVEDLLALAREGEHVDDPEAVELGAVAEQAWQTVETDTATLELGTDRTVRVDRSRLRRLFENLFANSVEHGGRDVTVRVTDLPDGFAVEDSGTGVSKTERDTVFDAGYSTSDDGTGFGLRVVEQVATSHGWTVDLTDGVDGGARFEFTGVDTGD
jgi:PAS domain S-box-containing protein